MSSNTVNGAVSSNGKPSLGDSRGLPAVVLKAIDRFAISQSNAQFGSFQVEFTKQRGEYTHVKFNSEVRVSVTDLPNFEF